MPDGRRLAVVQSVPTTGCAVSICTVNELDLFDATGAKPAERIASAAGLDSLTFRPPDGHQMLFRALIDGKYGLFTMMDDGSNRHALIEPNVPEHVDMTYGSAAYSADGARIFYQNGTADGCCQLWVMNADGTDPHEFLPRGAAWDGLPEVSPDGKWIAYWHNHNDGPAHGISVVRADGIGPVVETGPALAGGAHWIWSPDSSKILAFPVDATSAKAYLLDPRAVRGRRSPGDPTPTSTGSAWRRHPDQTRRAGSERDPGGTPIRGLAARRSISGAQGRRARLLSGFSCSCNPPPA